MVRKINGIVLREVQVGDNDKMLTVLTSELGKISVYAHSVMKYDSKNFSVSQLFTYSSLSLYERSNSYHLKEGTIIENFFGLRNDLSCSALASYIAETSLDISQENQNEENLLRLVLNSLYCISNNLKPLWQIKGVYELRVCKEIGMSPYISNCSNCSKEITDYSFFNISNGYVLCDECYHKNITTTEGYSDEMKGIYILPSTIVQTSPSVLKAMNFAINQKLEKVFSFKLGDSEIDDFSSICEKFFLAHIDRTFSSLDFYKNIAM